MAHFRRNPCPTPHWRKVNNSSGFAFFTSARSFSQHWRIAGLPLLRRPLCTDGLKTNHYDGLTSFTEVGEFVPLSHDRNGQVVREVAPASFALPLPDQKDQILPLQVALIRDLRRQVPCM